MVTGFILPLRVRPPDLIFQTDESLPAPIRGTQRVDMSPLCGSLEFSGEGEYPEVRTAPMRYFHVDKAGLLKSMDRYEALV